VGTPANVLAALERPVRGELVLALGARAPLAMPSPEPDELDAAIDEQIAAGVSPARAAKALAARAFGERGELYRKIAARKANAKSEAGL
jgi:16S rRNA C1402 (ribose-2'-O) methylase RsmI